jgi:hypothetical protein
LRSSTRPLLLPVVALALLSGCGTSMATRRFPLKDALWKDNDARPFSVDCTPDPKKPQHPVCAPEEYESPFVWDGVDAMLFRPVTRFFAVDPAGESVNVNAVDEVPDSSWFTNRIGKSPMTAEEVAKGWCDEHVLSPDDPDGSWVIDQGKENGANPGFRVNVPGVGKFLLKADESDHPERATAATAIATRFYHAAGFWTGCDSVIYVRRSLLKLTPGLTHSDNTGVVRKFGEKQLNKVLDGAARRGDLYRMMASKWLPGKTIGPFRYEGTRPDDPNDVIPHEDRRELRGQRLLAAWLDHFDSREQNSMNTWMSVNKKESDSSPGHIQHWIMDLNDCFGSEWQWDLMSRRINFSYYFDGGDIGQDFITLGIPERPWDKLKRAPDGEIFGYYEANEFEAEGWKPGYQNPTFVRMSEADGAWMARILSRFGPSHIEAAVKVGDFTQPKHHAYLVRTLIARQQKILARYFSKLSPVSDLAVDGARLCGVDLARKTATYADSRFRYSAVVHTGQSLEARQSANVAPGPDGAVCVDLPRVAGDGGEKDDSPSRYLVVKIQNGQADAPLSAHLYDLGPTKGYRLVGVER